MTVVSHSGDNFPGLQRTHLSRTASPTYLRDYIPIPEAKALDLLFNLLPFTLQPSEKKRIMLLEMCAHLLVIQTASVNCLRMHDATLSHSPVRSNLKHGCFQNVTGLT